MTDSTRFRKSQGLWSRFPPAFRRAKQLKERKGNRRERREDLGETNRREPILQCKEGYPQFRYRKPILRKSLVDLWNFCLSSAASIMSSTLSCFLSLEIQSKNGKGRGFARGKTAINRQKFWQAWEEAISCIWPLQDALYCCSSGRIFHDSSDCERKLT